MVGTIVIDGLFAAIAAIGFGAISNPPRRAFLSIAIAAAIGHALRFSLMHYVGVDIITASFCASFVIGWVSLFLGSLIYCPMTVVYIPALLPMIPGMYAYKTVFALLLFSRNLSDSDMVQRYMQEFFVNGIITCGVIFMLAVGATLPFILFPSKPYSLTRRKPGVGTLAQRRTAGRNRTQEVPYRFFPDERLGLKVNNLLAFFATYTIFACGKWQEGD